MTTLSLRLAKSLHRKVGEVAARDGVSINQFISTAVAEKLSALLTGEYLEERAQQASVEKALEVLQRVPDVAPVSGDELPAGLPTRRRSNVAG